MSRSALAYCSIATLLGAIIAGLLSLGPIAAAWQLRLPTTIMGFILIGWPVNLCMLRYFAQHLPKSQTKTPKHTQQ